MSLSKKMKCSEESTSRNFQEWWTFKYGMIFKNNKALCVLCSESVVCRTSSVKRHFETTHKTLLTKSADELKCFISRALSNKDAQSDKLIKFVKKSDNLVSASFDVAKSIAVWGKPFSDGDFIKMSWLDCADNLFQDFDNKDAIIQRIKDLSISRNTIKERILSMNSNIENQLIHDLNQSSFFSICIDESTDITSSARLSIISRFCINDEVREELIKLASVPAKTTGENICEVVVNVLEDIGLNLIKLKLIEEIEINRLKSNVVKNTDTEILKVWNSLPNTFNTLKKVAQSILSIFSSTYACESLFSIMNLIKTKQRNTLIDETSAACVSLKTTNYTPDIKMLSSKKQQQKSH